MRLEQSVSLHPYFRVHPGKLPAVENLLKRFVEKTAREADCLYYEFTRNDNVVFCREAYVHAEGVLTHLENVGAELQEMLAISDVIRVEVHGPADQLAKLKEPLEHLSAEWFEYVAGVTRQEG